jgi:hypothetical protein
MKNHRNITPTDSGTKCGNPRLILKRSLVSDRLGAQGFEEQAPDRNAEPNRTAKPDARRPGSLENN